MFVSQQGCSLDSESSVCVPLTFDQLPEELIVKILSFLPSRCLLTDVSLVNRMLNRLANDSSLWDRVHFRRSDSPEYVAAVLARFRNTIRSVTLDSRGSEVTATKIIKLNESKIAFEEISLSLNSCRLDLNLVFQLLCESTRILFLESNWLSEIRLFVNVDVLPKTNLVSLSVSEVCGLDDQILGVIVAACPKLELLDVGPNPGNDYGIRGIRAVADGLPNLAAVRLAGYCSDEACCYLLSKKPHLAAFGLSGLGFNVSPCTAAQISRMCHLQFLQFELYSGLSGETLRAMFENADFGQLRTLILQDLVEFDGATMEAMAVACPKLEQLKICMFFKSKPQPGAEDGVIKRMLESLPELRVFCFSGSEKITGQGWLDGIGTLLPLAQCVIVSRGYRDAAGGFQQEPSPEFFERAERARSAYPKLSIVIGGIDHPYNENVVMREYDVSGPLNLFPRLCDLKAGRVRVPNLLQEAVRMKLARYEDHRFVFSSES
jgi:hypothetical protein